MVGVATLALPTRATSATPASWFEVKQAGSDGVRHPLFVSAWGWDASGVPLVTTTSPSGYTPAQVRAYLGLTGTGAGQTVAIVSAYDNPTIAQDLAQFDATFGLPAPPSFKKVNQSGGTKYPSVDGGWALETALDVEWVHAVVPAAAILLVEASNSALSNMLSAISYAAKQSAVTVISNSYGLEGEFSGEASYDSKCALTKAVCVFSSGDSGNPGGYPAYNPYVLAVGGTTLAIDASGAIQSETAWEDSGGGVSLYETKPAYQSALPYPKRTIPDVSYDADPATGFAVYTATQYDGQSGWFQVGGTSAGAPQWSGIIAAANQLRKAAGKGPLVAYNSTAKTFPLHQAVYGLAPSLGDITVGSDGTCGAVCTAAPGFDPVTGNGSPRLALDVALRNAP